MLRQLSARQLAETEAYMRVEARPGPDEETIKASNTQLLKERFLQAFKRSDENGDGSNA